MSCVLALGSTQMQLCQCHRSLAAETPPQPHRIAARTQGTPVAWERDGCVSPAETPLLCSRCRDPSAQTQRCPPRPAGTESAHRRPTDHPNGTAQLPAPRAAPRASERDGARRHEARRGAFPPAARTAPRRDSYLSRRAGAERQRGARIPRPVLAWRESPPRRHLRRLRRRSRWQRPSGTEPRRGPGPLLWG